MKPISLFEVMRHSKQVEYVDVLEMSLSVQPWTIAQLHALKPLISKIFEEVRSQPKDQEMLVAFMSVVIRDGFFEDVLEIVYTTLERSNQKITYKGTEHAFFTKEDFSQNFLIEFLAPIMKIIYKQNFEKNLSTGLNQETTKEEEVKAETPQEEAKAQ